MRGRARLFCGAVALLFGAQAWGQTTWSLSTLTNNDGWPDGTTLMTATGWANTGSGSTIDAQLLEQQPAGTNLIWYSGGRGINNLDGCSSGDNCDVGDVASTQPEHAIDNEQRYEMMLLNFSKPVILKQVLSAWTGTDSDITVMAYSPSTSIVSSLASQTWGSLTAASGWNVIGNYAFSDNSTATQSVNINAGNAYSSSWLIGAFNPLVSSNVGKTGMLTDGFDYFKLLKVSGYLCDSTKCPPDQGGGVPEPGSLALLASALLGVLGVTRRRRT